MLVRILLAAAVFGSMLGSASAAEPAGPWIVFMVGEDEYRTEVTLPDFADKDLAPRGYRCTFIHSSAADPNDFAGLEQALDNADLLLVSVRRRSPKTPQMDAVRAYVESGRPLAGIRTASHAFALRNTPPPPEGCSVWPTFDPDVLGGNYHGHHKNTLLPQITAAAGAAEHPILSGVELPLRSGGSLYEVRPLTSGTTPLLVGAIEQADPEPVAWTHLRGKQRVFYTSLGHVDDFAQPAFRRLLANGIDWALDRPPQK